MKVTLKNESTQMIKECKLGFSWTTFCFGFFPAFFRGDWKWGFIQLALVLVIGLCTAGYGGGFIELVFCFIYNKIYIKELIEKNYRPATQRDADLLIGKGILPVGYTVEG